MFAIDPGAALREARRVLRPSGRAAFAVWDAPEHNPWATIPRQALIEAGLLEPPDPDAPGPFALATPGLLGELFEDAGFTGVQVQTVDVVRRHPDAESMMAVTVSVSEAVAALWPRLSDAQRAAITARVAELTVPYTDADGIRLPGRTFVAAADA